MELKEYILKNECLEIHVCNLIPLNNILTRSTGRIILISARSSGATATVSKAGRLRLTTRLTR